MSASNWRVVAPILAVGVLFIALALWRSAQAAGGFLPVILLGVPILAVGFGLMGLAAWLRRRKSATTWELMRLHGPDGDHSFIAFIYPSVRRELNRLGWHFRGPAFASIPAIGVNIGPTAITLWEAGSAEPTLTISGGEIASVAAGRVSDGFRGHQALDLTLSTRSRSRLLQLNLRNVHHHDISVWERNRAIGQVLKLRAASSG